MPGAGRLEIRRPIQPSPLRPRAIRQTFRSPAHRPCLLSIRRRSQRTSPTIPYRIATAMPHPLQSPTAKQAKRRRRRRLPCHRRPTPARSSRWPPPLQPPCNSPFRLRRYGPDQHKGQPTRSTAMPITPWPWAAPRPPMWRPRLRRQSRTRRLRQRRPVRHRQRPDHPLQPRHRHRRHNRARLHPRRARLQHRATRRYRISPPKWRGRIWPRKKRRTIRPKPDKARRLQRTGRRPDYRMRRKLRSPPRLRMPSAWRPPMQLSLTPRALLPKMRPNRQVRLPITEKRPNRTQTIAIPPSRPATARRVPSPRKPRRRPRLQTMQRRGRRMAARSSKPRRRLLPSQVQPLAPRSRPSMCMSRHRICRRQM